MGDQRLGDIEGHVAGDGEADPLVAARLGHDYGVDPDDFSAQIQQRAAAVPGIDRGIGLQEILITAGIRDSGAMLRADDPLGDGLVQAARMADRHDPFAHLDLVRIPEGRVGHRALCGNLDHGQIGFRIRADKVGGIPVSVGKHHLDLGRPARHMVVGHDMAPVVDDDARSEALRLAFEFLRHLRNVEEAPEKRVIREGQQGVGHLPALRHFDMRHGGDGLLGHLHDGRAEIEVLRPLRREGGRSMEGQEQRPQPQRPEKETAQPAAADGYRHKNLRLQSASGKGRKRNMPRTSSPPPCSGASSRRPRRGAAAVPTNRAPSLGRGMGDPRISTESRPDTCHSRFLRRPSRRSSAQRRRTA